MAFSKTILIKKLSWFKIEAKEVVKSTRKVAETRVIVLIISLKIEIKKSARL